MKKSIFCAAALAFFLSANARLTLFYDRPAEFFEESLVIGNGTIGAAVYHGLQADSLSLNNITLWSGEPEKGVWNPDGHNFIPEIEAALKKGDYKAADSLQCLIQGHFSSDYQPLGNLYISYLPKDLDVSPENNTFSRYLDLENAETYSLNNIREITNFSSAPDKVIVTRINLKTPGAVVLATHSKLPFTLQNNGNDLIMEGYAPYYSLPGYRKDTHREYDPERGVHFAAIHHIITPNGGLVKFTPKGAALVDGADEIIVISALETDFDKYFHDSTPAIEKARKIINDASGKPYAHLRDAHRNDFGKYFSRVSLDLGETPAEIAALPTDRQLKLYTDSAQANPDLEELYFQMGRYLLISCSRTPGVPANLQGLWNEDLTPPWSSNYTTNINLQENYWPALNCNLAEMNQPLLDFITRLTKSGESTAIYTYGAKRGWCLGQNTDIWAMTNPVGERKGLPLWANWNMGGAWLASHILENYHFTGDLKSLAQCYPALRGAAQFCIEMLQPDQEGFLAPLPSTSPENTYITPEGYRGATVHGTTADIAITRQCLTDARLAAHILNIDPEFIAEINSVLPKLRPYRIGAKGNLQEWPEDWRDFDPKHRHQSHLYGLYPGHQITPELTPDLASACAKTLEMRGPKTTGWSTGWRINLQGRLLQGENAYSMLRNLLTYISPDKFQGPDKRKGGGTYPNLLDAHSPFQIDGNFGGTAGIAEMLVQSTPESITLLPALPAQWSEGSVKGLKARGGWTVDFTWKDQKVTSATLIPGHSKNTTLKVNGNTIKVEANDAKPLLFDF